MDFKSFIADGLPICPACGKPIQPQENGARPDGCIVHVWCYPEADTREEPCEPQP